MDIKEQGVKLRATRTRLGKGSATVAVQQGTSVVRVHDVIQRRNMTEWKDVSEIEEMYKRLRGLERHAKKRKRETHIKSESAVWTWTCV